MVVAKGKGVMVSDYLMGTEFQFCKMKEFWRWMLMMVTQQSVQFSCSVMSDSVTHGLWHARLPCLSPTPRACSNSCPYECI